MAIRTKAQLIEFNNSNITDNDNQEITGPIHNQMNRDIIDTMATEEFVRESILNEGSPIASAFERITREFLAEPVITTYDFGEASPVTSNYNGWRFPIRFTRKFRAAEFIFRTNGSADHLIEAFVWNADRTQILARGFSYTRQNSGEERVIVIFDNEINDDINGVDQNSTVWIGYRSSTNVALSVANANLSGNGRSVFTGDVFQVYNSVNNTWVNSSVSDAFLNLYDLSDIQGVRDIMQDEIDISDDVNMLLTRTVNYTSSAVIEESLNTVLSPSGSPFGGWGQDYTNTGRAFNAVRLRLFQRESVADDRRWSSIEVFVKDRSDSVDILARSGRIDVNPSETVIDNLIVPLLNPERTRVLTIGNGDIIKNEYFIGIIFYNADGNVAYGGANESEIANATGNSYYSADTNPNTWILITRNNPVGFEHLFLSQADITREIDGLAQKINKVDGAVPGNIAVFDNNGNIIDSGVTPDTGQAPNFVELSLIRTPSLVTIVPTNGPNLDIPAADNVNAGIMTALNVQAIDSNTTYRNIGHIPLSQIGANGGVAPLGSNGIVPANHLPVIESDIIEATTLAQLPAVGQPRKLYVTTSNNTQYRWSGTQYVEFETGRVDSVFGREGVIVAQSGDYNAGQITETAARVFVTPQQKTDIGLNTAVRHSHNNLSILNDIVNAGSGSIITAAERTKLSGIAAGAEVNVQANWNEANQSSDAFILNKPTNIAFTNVNNNFSTAQTINGTLTINGDFIVQGTTTTLNPVDLNVSDNIITVNNGEIGAGVSIGFAGIQVDRGSAPDYAFLFNESTDTFRIGIFDTLSGDVVSATANTIVLSVGSTTNDAYNGILIRVTKQGEQPQVRTISDYVGSTRTATVSSPWTVIPDNTWDFRILVSDQTQAVLTRQDSPVSNGFFFWNNAQNRADSKILVATDISNFSSAVSSNASVSANTSARHTHPNLSILNNIVSSGSGSIITSTERTKLAGIQAGAEVNVQANWTETNSSSDAFIRNKPNLFNVVISTVDQFIDGRFIFANGLRANRIVTITDQNDMLLFHDNGQINKYFVSLFGRNHRISLASDDNGANKELLYEILNSSGNPTTTYQIYHEGNIPSFLSANVDQRITGVLTMDATNRAEKLRIGFSQSSSEWIGFYSEQTRDGYIGYDVGVEEEQGTIVLVNEVNFSQLKIGRGDSGLVYNVLGSDFIVYHTGNFTADSVPNLDASKVVSGVFSSARIPNLDASKITSGSFPADRIPSLPASRITSGAFDQARIPNLPASRITSGAFNSARIPNLDATKITSGVFSVDRIPSLATSKIFLFDRSVQDIVGGMVSGNSETGGISVTYNSSNQKLNFALSGVNASSLGGVGAGSFVRSDADDSISGLITHARNSDEQIRLGQGVSRSAFVSWYESNTRRAFIQYDIAGNQFRFVNDETDEELRVASGNDGLLFVTDGAVRTVYHNGNLTAARIPSLDASKITSGVFNIDRIPNLSAFKIISGILDNERLNSSVVRTDIGGVLTQYQGATDPVGTFVVNTNNRHYYLTTGYITINQPTRLHITNVSNTQFVTLFLNVVGTRGIGFINANVNGPETDTRWSSENKNFNLESGRYVMTISRVGGDFHAICSPRMV